MPVMLCLIRFGCTQTPPNVSKCLPRQTDRVRVCLRFQGVIQFAQFKKKHHWQARLHPCILPMCLGIFYIATYKISLMSLVSSAPHAPKFTISSKKNVPHVSKNT